MHYLSLPRTSSHRIPVKLCGQVQLKPCTKSMHVPSFRHGLLEHSFTSRKKIVVGLSCVPLKDMNFYIHHSREKAVQQNTTETKIIKYTITIIVKIIIISIIIILIIIFIIVSVQNSQEKVVVSVWEKVLENGETSQAFKARRKAENVSDWHGKPLHFQSAMRPLCCNLI